MRIGRVKIDDIFNAVLWDKLEVVHREVAVWIDNTITLVVINIAKREKREKTRLTGAGLTNDIDMAATVFAVHAELMLDTAEIRETKCGKILVVARVAGKHWKLGWWLSSLAGGPDDVWRLHIHVWEVIDASELGDIQNEAMIGELASLIGIERALVESAANHLEAIEVSRVELLESTDEALHIKFCVDLVLAHVGEANLYLVAKLRSLLFSLRNLCLSTFAKLDGRVGFCAALWWFPKRLNELRKPSKVDIAEAKAFAGFYFLNPAVGLRVPVVGDRTSKNLNPKLFAAIRIKLRECTGDTGEWVDLEGLKGLNW